MGKALLFHVGNHLHINILNISLISGTSEMMRSHYEVLLNKPFIFSVVYV